MSGTVLGVLIVVFLVLYYVSSCAFWPYSRCGKCKGEGRFPAWWGGRAFRFCGRCGGAGRRLRFGRWIYNYVRDKQKASQR